MVVMFSGRRHGGLGIAPKPEPPCRRLLNESADVLHPFQGGPPWTRARPYSLPVPDCAISRVRRSIRWAASN